LKADHGTSTRFFWRISATGLVVGKDYFLVFSPNANREIQSFHTHDSESSGGTTKCLEVGEALYSQVIDKVVAVSSTRARDGKAAREHLQIRQYRTRE
jgi:UDP-N-acetyl-D-glucosamine dehydrogenase